MTKLDEERKASAIADLRELFPVGSTVSVKLNHVSRSGMMRAISVLAVIDGGVSDVSWLVARATGARFNGRWGGITLGGCGMDMGFALVYGLARTLYRDGFACTGEKCGANDHSNERGTDRDYTPGRLHSDPGYALHHRWV